MTAAIDFYFDFGSPYGYFAARQIDAMAARHGATVAWRPILLGAVFKVTGMKPYAQQPLRDVYLRRDVHRIARLTGAPYVWPDVMPLNPVNASRAYWWLADHDPDAARRLALALFHAHWGEGRDLAAADAVADVAASAGFDRAAVTAALRDQTVKDRLRDETERAIARGVYGSPFIFVGDEPFWGWDRLDMAERWLATGGW